MGLKRLLDAQQEREEREAIRDVWRVQALARVMGGGGVTHEELLAELVGRERARAIVEAPEKWKARQRALEE